MFVYIFKSVLLCSAVGTVLFLVLLILRPLTQRRFSSLWHYITGLCVMLIMIAPLRITLPKSYISSVQNNIQTEEKNDYINNESENYVLYETDIRNNSVTDTDFLLTVVSYIWASVVIILFLKKELSYQLYIKKLKKDTEEAGEYCLTENRHLRIHKGENVSSPMIAGVFSPILYLPDIPLSENELEVIVSHEIIHLQRKDLIAKRFISAVKCIHFFNPAVYFMANKINLDCEISCDLAATNGMKSDEKRNYMVTILALASKSSSAVPSLSVGIIQGKDALKRRFIKINSREKINKKTKTVSAVIAAVTISSTLLISGILASGIEKPALKFEETTSEIETLSAERFADDLSHSVYIEETTSFEDVTTNPVSYGTDKLLYPCGEREIVCRFGDKDRKNHDGVDFAVQLYSPVYAATSAEVIFAGEDKDIDGGIMIKLKASDGMILFYKHLDSVFVNKGDAVRPGDIIAKSGATGIATGPCLHFSVVKDGKYVDPMNYLG